MTAQFVHLNVHSDYSMIDGICRLNALAKHAAKMAMPAIGLTDQCNLFGLVKFYRSQMAAGIKPIIGCDLLWHHDADHADTHRIILLCQNDIGYHNLIRLISRGYTDGERAGDIPLYQHAWFEPAAMEGLIALSGGCDSDIGKALIAGKSDKATNALRDWHARMPERFYLELRRTGRANEEAYIRSALQMSQQQAIAVVATNDVCFLERKDFEAQQARICIHDGQLLHDERRICRHSEQQYCRSMQEMCELFSDIPAAISNTVQIAKRCNVALDLGRHVLPQFPIPDKSSPEKYLTAMAKKGLSTRLAALFDHDQKARAEKTPPYQERLSSELAVINKMGFAGYFLIVADFIQWAKNNQIPVGPGRGSGAGSLVAYALNITDIDPLAYDLLFERFLNPERVSMPDFDIDFCMDKRDQVIDYVATRYGRQCVSQIITFGTMAAKAVVRDVGRVLGHPYGFVDKIAKCIPFELGITLQSALANEDALRLLYEKDEQVRDVIDLARQLEGLARNVSKHAGGVVISPSALTDFTPIYCEKGHAQRLSQFDKDDVEAVGLVKFDFLGLRTLTIIDWTCKAIEKQAGEKIAIDRIPLDCPQTFALLQSCQSTGIFQLESRGMRDLIKRLSPDCFEDIIALVALFRPGPLQSGMVDDFIDRKHGRARVAYPHPALEPILKPTYGVILYQEQVMQIAQVLANYTLGGADLLRRAMGKKKPSEMAKQRAIFLTGAIERDVDKETASLIFDLMEKFAGYGFNKSHSAAYAMVSYQTAWLKTHYPNVFMSCVLSADMDNTDKVVFLVDECRRLGISVLPPDINHCGEKFLSKDGHILYGLGAIKGVGATAITSIVQSRERAGPFTNLLSFCKRNDLRKVNRRTIDALIRSGAMDSMDMNRASLIASLDKAMQLAGQWTRDRASGQGSLFAADDGFVANDENDKAWRVCVNDWPQAQRLQGEKETVGLYLTGHPITQLLPELEQFISARIADLQPCDGRQVVIAGIITRLRRIKTKSGKPLVIITLDDQSARVECVIFSDLLETANALLGEESVVVISGEANKDDYSGGIRVRVESIMSFNDARDQYGRGIALSVHAEKMNDQFMQQLADVLRPFCGGQHPVVIQYCNDKYQIPLHLASAWNVQLQTPLLTALSRYLGDTAISISY